MNIYIYICKHSFHEGLGKIIMPLQFLLASSSTVAASETHITAAQWKTGASICHEMTRFITDEWM